MNLEKETVIISDLHEEKSLKTLIKRALKIIGEEYVDPNSPILSIKEIRSSVEKKIKNKQYDFMILMETGGRVILGSKTITGHSKQVANLYAHGEAMGVADDRIKVAADIIKDFVNKKYKKEIEKSKRIAIVEGDAGTGYLSSLRLFIVKEMLLKANPKLKVDIIIGVVAKKVLENGAYSKDRKQFGKLLDAKFPKSYFKTVITGIIVSDLQKFSEILEAVLKSPEYTKHPNDAAGMKALDSLEFVRKYRIVPRD